MFGVLYVIGSLFSSTARSIKEDIDNYNSKQQTSNGYYYTDRKGIQRLLSNDHPISIRWNAETEMNDYIDLKTMKVIKSEAPPAHKKLYEKKIAECKAKGYTTYIKKIRGFKLEECTYQDIYKDIYTGDEYVIRIIRGKQYFIDIRTGKPVRESDYEKCRTFPNKAEGIHDDEWNKSMDLTLISDPNFPEAIIF